MKTRMFNTFRPLIAMVIVKDVLETSQQTILGLQVWSPQIYPIKSF